MKKRLGYRLALAVLLIISTLSAPGAAGEKKRSSTYNDESVLSQLPLSLQYSSPEWQEILLNFRTRRDVSVDPMNSDTVDCANCAMIVNGQLLFPPFYFQRIRDQVFVNGYQIYPTKTKYLFPPKKMMADAAPLPKVVCRERIYAVDRILGQMVGLSYAPNEKEMWVRQELDKQNIEINDMKIGEESWYLIYTPGPKCPVEKMTGKTRPADVPRQNLLTFSINRNVKDYLDNSIAAFRAKIEDDTLIMPHDIYNSNIVHYKTLGRIVEVLEKNSLDDRIKLYQLSKQHNIFSFAGAYILANRDAFLNAYRNRR